MERVERPQAVCDRSTRSLRDRSDGRRPSIAFHVGPIVVESTGACLAAAGASRRAISAPDLEIAEMLTQRTRSLASQKSRDLVARRAPE